MSGGARLLVLIVVGGVLLMTVSVGLAAASIVRGGTVAVDMREDDGAAVSVHAPAALFDLVLLFIPDHTVSFALEHSDLHDDAALDQIEDYIPAVRDAWRELVDAEDFTMVEVTGDDVLVRVEKQRDQLVIHVESDDGRFDATLPLRTVSRALGKL